MEPGEPDPPKSRARGVQDPGRKVLVRVAQAALRSKLWESFAIDPREKVGRIIDSRERTGVLAKELAERWCWLMGDDPIQQSNICKWRLRWLKALKNSQCGTGRDTTLLPAAWGRINNIMNNSPYFVADLPRHAASIINIDPLVQSEGVWTDLSIRGTQKPVDGRACFVFQEHTLNKPDICRSWRSLQHHRFSWEVPPMDRYNALRYLPSRRPEEPVEYRDYLGELTSQTVRGRVQFNLISKKSSRLDIKITRV